MSLLVPSRTGPEISEVVPGGIAYDEPGASFSAMIGSGFNPDNIQHQKGSDGLRYAIALAQFREDKDFEAFDAARSLVLSGPYRVDVSKSHVKVVFETALMREDRERAARKRKNSRHRA